MVCVLGSELAGCGVSRQAAASAAGRAARGQGLHTSCARSPAQQRAVYFLRAVVPAGATATTTCKRSLRSQPAPPVLLGPPSWPSRPARGRAPPPRRACSSAAAAPVAAGRQTSRPKAAQSPPPCEPRAARLLARAGAGQHQQIIRTSGWGLVRRS
jgi:hypothetical protein